MEGQGQFRSHSPPLQPNVPEQLGRPSEEMLNKRAGMVHHMLNGDWIQEDHLVHVESGCCPGGVGECKLKYTAALLQGLGVTLYGSGVPSVSRWGTMSTTNSEFVLAEMCHRALHRLFARTFKSKAWGSL